MIDKMYEVFIKSPAMRAWAEINIDSIVHNFKVARESVPNNKKSVVL